MPGTTNNDRRRYDAFCLDCLKPDRVTQIVSAGCDMGRREAASNIESQTQRDAFLNETARHSPYKIRRGDTWYGRDYLIVCVA